MQHGQPQQHRAARAGQELGSGEVPCVQTWRKAGKSAQCANVTEFRHSQQGSMQNASVFAQPCAWYVLVAMDS